MIHTGTAQTRPQPETQKKKRKRCSGGVWKVQLEPAKHCRPNRRSTKWSEIARTRRTLPITTMNPITPSLCAFVCAGPVVGTTQTPRLSAIPQGMSSTKSWHQIKMHLIMRRTASRICAEVPCMGFVPFLMLLRGAPRASSRQRLQGKRSLGARKTTLDGLEKHATQEIRTFVNPARRSAWSQSRAPHPHRYAFNQSHTRGAHPARACPPRPLRCPPRWTGTAAATGPRTRCAAS